MGPNETDMQLEVLATPIEKDRGVEGYSEIGPLMHKLVGFLHQLQCIHR